MTLIVVDGRLTRSHLARRHCSARRRYQWDHRGSNRLYCMPPPNGTSLRSVTNCVWVGYCRRHRCTLSVDRVAASVGLKLRSMRATIRIDNWLSWARTL